MSEKTLDEIVEYIKTHTSKTNSSAWYFSSRLTPVISETIIRTNFKIGGNTRISEWCIELSPTISMLSKYDVYSIVLSKFVDNTIILNVHHKIVDETPIALMTKNGTIIEGHVFQAGFNEIDAIKQIIHNIEDYYKTEVPIEIWDFFEDWRTLVMENNKMFSLSGLGN